MYKQHYRQYLSEALPNNLYSVGEEDTFYQIAHFFNISLDDLLEANPEVDPDTLSAGQTLYIPVPAPSANCPLGANTYMLQKNDTFYSVSKKFSISLSTLLKANPKINPDGLLTGQSLCIPTTWSIYRNDTYRIAFKYPFRWRRIDDERYAGIDGFFQILTLPQNNLEEAYREEVFHKLKPYGSAPDIKAVIVHGQKSSLIHPSADQPNAMRGQAALIVEPAIPLTIAGMRYRYFALRADKDHIREIVNSISYESGAPLL